MKIFGNLELMQNILKEAVIEKGSTEPTYPTPVQGQIFYNTSSNKLECYNGTEWKSCGGDLPEVAEDATKYFDGLVGGVFKQKAFIEAPMTGLVVGTVLDPSKNLGENLKLLDDATTQAKSFTIKKEATAETGYLSSYKLYHTIAGTMTPVGDTINIPMDYLVKSAEVKVCITKDVPVAGLNPGDKYLDFTVNVKEGTGTESHIYLAIKDMGNTYTNGDGLSLSDANVFSVKAKTNAGIIVDSDGVSVSVGNGIELSTAGAVQVKPKANSGIDVTSEGVAAKLKANAGLTVSADGLSVDTGNTTEIGSTTNKLEVKLKTGSGLDGDSGGLFAKAYNGINIDDNGIGVKIKAGEASGLSVDSTGLTLSMATDSTSGAMSATDHKIFTYQTFVFSKTAASGAIVFAPSEVGNLNIIGGELEIIDVSTGEVIIPSAITISSGSLTCTFTGTGSEALPVKGTATFKLSAT